ncbi:MAG: hypothetical protein DRQ89_09270 [Epsilonproteobacteria bacterium]|nr:MAG: hypothetical protein DRQ89_09270 [Campylobacterota bacterium]
MKNINQKITPRSKLYRGYTMALKISPLIPSDSPRVKCLDTVIEFIRKQNPRNSAMQMGDKYFTYKELEEKSDELALKLRQNGIHTEDKVVVMLPPCFELVVATYAIMKAGAVYVPVNPGDGNERIKFILEDLVGRFVLGNSETLEKIENLTSAALWKLDLGEEEFIKSYKNNPISNKEDAILPDVAPNNLAFIIYTSGTTGRPKGVMLEHLNLSVFIKTMRDAFEVSTSDRWLQNPNIHFDLAVGTMFLSLCNGSTLVLGTGDLAEMMETYNITHYMGTPSTASLMEPSRLPHLKAISVAGEKCPDELIARFAPYSSLYVGYGPAETTIICTLNQSNQWKKQNIGTILEGVEYYVVKPDGTLACDGESGELWIAGDFVARGYLNRPELTNEKFIDNPFGKGRLYKSGDRTRWVKPGFMEFIGRVDRQVKIRGHRVELDGLELLINGYNEIKGTHARIIGDNLVAYVVTSSPDEKGLITFLKKQLPPYAIPTKIVFLKKFPLTHSGKIDSSSFPDPFKDSLRQGVLPKREREILLAQLWQSILPGNNQIFMEDNFFDLGGTSLHVMKLTGKMRRVLSNPKIPLELLYENPHFESFVLALGLWEGKATKKQSLEDLGGVFKLTLDFLKCLPSMAIFSIGIFIPFWTFLILVVVYPPFILFALIEYLILNITGPIEIPLLRKIIYSKFLNKVAFKNVEIKGNTNFKGAIISLHPHGVTDCHFYPLAGHLSKNGIDFKVAFDKVQMNLPLNRTLHGLVGYVQGMEESYVKCKEKGQSIVVTPGEKPEWLGSHLEAKLYLRHNINLFKIALKTGMPLVPVYAFNMHKTFKFYPNLLEAWDKLPVAPGSAFLPFFRGRWGLPIPFRKDLKMVIGEPIKVVQNSNPSWEEVEALYELYVSSLKNLYKKHTPIDAKSLEIS